MVVLTCLQDFWKVIWEQDVRVIVMLTAESEGGQLKCHRYWDGTSFGPLRLALRDEHRVPLDRSKKTARPAPPHRRKTSSLMTPRSTSAPIGGGFEAQKDGSKDEEPPYVIVRRFSLRHTAQPFVPIREITQLCYSSWPDFGAPAHPQHLLGLVEQCDKVSRAAAATASSTAESVFQRPVLVHCSAGCGRTGTFCTVDSVMEMLKRQRDAMNGKIELEEWMQHDEIDLIEHTVQALREQRISMVQNLSQYVLAYETVLEWCTGLIEAEAANGPKTPKTPKTG
jgi:protein tyrosine phosphatase